MRISRDNAFVDIECGSRKDHNPIDYRREGTETDHIGYGRGATLVKDAVKCE